MQRVLCVPGAWCLLNATSRSATATQRPGTSQTPAQKERRVTQAVEGTATNSPLHIRNMNKVQEPPQTSTKLNMGLHACALIQNVVNIVTAGKPLHNQTASKQAC